MASRELYESRIKMGQKGDSDFLTVGSMGHASSIALGIALHAPDRTIFCIDGDGAMLMHMGALSTIAESGVTNLKHIVINNGAHDSVGGQPTCGFQSRFWKKLQKHVLSKNMAGNNWRRTYKCSGRVHHHKRPRTPWSSSEKGARKDLSRPKSSPAENKIKLMQYLRNWLWNTLNHFTDFFVPFSLMLNRFL